MSRHVAYVLTIFGQFWKSNYIYKFLPIQDTSIDFSEWSNNENGYCFCQGLEGRFSWRVFDESYF